MSPVHGALESRFFGAHLRVEQDADGGERLVGFNASEEPTSALLNFFEYDSGFRLLNKVTHRLQVQMVAHEVCLLSSRFAPWRVYGPFCCLARTWTDLRPSVKSCTHCRCVHLCPMT